MIDFSLERILQYQEGLRNVVNEVDRSLQEVKSVSESLMRQIIREINSLNEDIGNAHKDHELSVRIQGKFPSVLAKANNELAKLKSESVAMHSSRAQTSEEKAAYQQEVKKHKETVAQLESKVRGLMYQKVSNEHGGFDVRSTMSCLTERTRRIETCIREMTQSRSQLSHLLQSLQEAVAAYAEICKREQSAANHIAGSIQKVIHWAQGSLVTALTDLNDGLPLQNAEYVYPNDGNEFLLLANSLRESVRSLSEELQVLRNSIGEYSSRIRDAISEEAEETVEDLRMQLERLQQDMVLDGTNLEAVYSAFAEYVKMRV